MGEATIFSVSLDANVARHIGIGMIGRRYRLEWVEMVDGVATINAYDDRVFDSQKQALAEKRAIQGAAR